MLCDELRADGASASGMLVGPIIERIGKAQKFVMGSEFAAVADALSEDYSGLVRAFEHCRLPYSSVWLEVLHADRPRFCAASMHAPAFQMKPKRVGYLLTATRDDLAAWKAHLFWSLPNGQCSAAGMAMNLDMTRPLCGVLKVPTLEEEEAARTKRFRSGILNPNMPPHPGWAHASESVKLAMLRHTSPSPADYDLPVPTGIPRHRWGEFYNAVLELARADWAGEPTFLLAAVVLMNARNAVETQAVDLERLNRARARRGALPLFEHRVVQIARRQAKRVSEARKGSAGHVPMREHFCRGHFKTRKSGVFFWHPHLRGDRTRGRIEKEYEL